MARMVVIFFPALTFHSMFAPPLEYRVTPDLTSAADIVMGAGMKLQGKEEAALLQHSLQNRALVKEVEETEECNTHRITAKVALSTQYLCRQVESLLVM